MPVSSRSYRRALRRAAWRVQSSAVRVAGVVLPVVGVLALVASIIAGVQAAQAPEDPRALLTAFTIWILLGSLAGRSRELQVFQRFAIAGLIVFPGVWCVYIAGSGSVLWWARFVALAGIGIGALAVGQGMRALIGADLPFPRPEDRERCHGEPLLCPGPPCPMSHPYERAVNQLRDAAFCAWLLVPAALMIGALWIIPALLSATMNPVLLGEIASKDVRVLMLAGTVAFAVAAGSFGLGSMLQAYSCREGAGGTSPPRWVARLALIRQRLAPLRRLLLPLKSDRVGHLWESAPEGPLAHALGITGLIFLALLGVDLLTFGLPLGPADVPAALAVAGPLAAFCVVSAAIAYFLRIAVLQAVELAPAAAYAKAGWFGSNERRQSLTRVRSEASTLLWTYGSLIVLLIVLYCLYRVIHWMPTDPEVSAQLTFLTVAHSVALYGSVVLSLLTAGAASLVNNAFKELRLMRCEVVSRDRPAVKP